MTPRSKRRQQRDNSPVSQRVGGLLVSNRQSLVWLLSMTMFFSCFLGWQHRLPYEESAFHEESRVNKAFQVDALKQNRTNPVRQISLIGERNSGTKWIWAHLYDCFNHAIPVEKKFTRYKHWFQPNVHSRYLHDTLVIAQFRNPYDWLTAMHAVPHHSPAHAGLEWEEFLSKPWTTKRSGLDLTLKGDELCQHYFEYKDLISCVHKPEPWVPVDNRTSLDKPIYEMRNDGSGTPYDNIMEMRSDKIRNMFDIKDYEGVADVWMIQYEYMVKTGTSKLLDRVAEWTGVKPQCKPYPPQDRRQREMPEDFVQYVTDHLNWTAEAFIGYEPMREIRSVKRKPAKFAVGTIINDPFADEQKTKLTNEYAV